MCFARSLNDWLLIASVFAAPHEVKCDLVDLDARSLLSQHRQHQRTALGKRIVSLLDRDAATRDYPKPRMSMNQVGLMIRCGSVQNPHPKLGIEFGTNSMRMSTGLQKVDALVEQSVECIEQRLLVAFASWEFARDEVANLTTANLWCGCNPLSTSLAWHLSNDTSRPVSRYLYVYAPRCRHRD